MAFTDSQTCKETFSIIKGTIIIENYEQIIHEPNYLKKTPIIYIKESIIIWIFTVGLPSTGGPSTGQKPSAGLFKRKNSYRRALIS